MLKLDLTFYSVFSLIIVVDETGYESWQSWKQWCCGLRWKLSNCAQSFVFCLQIVTEWINAMFLLVNKFKTIGIPLVQGQVQRG